MTSPVDTSVKHFSSLMTGAPTLNGTVGAMIALIDACAKDGFGSLTLTSLVVAGGVATATWAGTHPAMVDSVVLISGVTGALVALNGEQKVVTKPGATSLTFATAAADGTATGTIVMKMAPLGFAKIFSGTNLAAYQSTDPASQKMILRLDDTNAQVTRVVGCEVMSDISTYSGLFPTAAQMSGGGYWCKSNAASSGAVQWMLIGDSRGFFLHVCPGYVTNVTFSGGATRYFGDLVALRPGGDGYAVALSYSISATPNAQIDGQPEWFNSQALQAMPRGPTGLGTSLLNGCMPYTGVSSAVSGNDAFFGPFPSIIDGALRLSKRYLAPGTSLPPRAEMPGMYSVPHNNCFDSFKFNDRVAGTGLLLGKNLICVNSAFGTMNQAAAVGSAGATFFDITGPWPR